MSTLDVSSKALKDAILKNDKDEVSKILCDHPEVDLISINGGEGNAINFAIENADVHMVALLLGIQYPPGESVGAISSTQHARINCACDSEDLTPLMKAVKLRNIEMVSMLLHCGAEVNCYTQDGKAAVDFTDDPEILCALFEHDSVFPIRINKAREVSCIISEDEGRLSDLFKARDAVHDSIKGGCSENVKKPLDAETKAAIMRGKYFVNREGRSLLYTALTYENFDVWADLLGIGMDYTTLEEKEAEYSREEMCERALANVLVPLADCHVMKLVAKSVNRRSYTQGKDLSRIVLEYFEYMNDNEITKTLMEVVQDVPGLQIAFDFDCGSVERIRACCLKDVRGITDIKLCKISVAAKEEDHIGFREIVSNVVHEICHLAMAIVYKNNGLPYARQDMSRKEQYYEVLAKVRSSEGCDDIICKVWRYDSALHGRELIVRVPEMISKYQRNVPDGISRLEVQAESLLDFYREKVQPDLEKYISSSVTSNVIMGRGLLEYLELLSQADKLGLNVCVDKDITNFIGRHNNLKVLKASNVELARDHVKSSWEKKGSAAPVFVNWSLCKQWPEFFMKGLQTREIETLVIIWDINETPPFCKRSGCYGDCVGFFFREFTDCVYFLVNDKWQVLREIWPIEYSWEDLSLATKMMIQEKDVELGGVFVQMKTLISSSEGGDNVEDSMSKLLDSTDINLLLGAEDIKLGAPNCQGGNIVLKPNGVFIPRKLSRKFVDFDGSELRKHTKDVFFVSNIEISHLYDLGISESYVRQWDVGSCSVSVQCYALHPLLDAETEKSAFQEILEHLRSVRGGQVKRLHHLKFTQGLFALVKSTNIQNSTDDSVDEVESLKFYTVEKQLEASDFEGNDPLMIASDAGTGKTTYLHSIAKDIKGSHPGKWVSIVDLSSQTHQNHLERIHGRKSSSQKETLDSLFRMVGSGQEHSLERKVFNKFCEMVNKIVVFFDGFDEICPKYKSLVTSFIVDLRKFNRNIKLLVATRVHEKQDLETALGAITYQLVPFTENDQVKFLDEYWNELLKGLPLSARLEKIKCSVDGFKRRVEEESGDDITKLISRMEKVLSNSSNNKKLVRMRIDFKPLARRVLLGWDTSCNALDRFTETPLHIQMFASLIFEDSFNMKGTMNLGHLYQRFFGLKMKIYGREKGGSSGNVQSEELMRMVQERIVETLEKLSVNLFEVGRTFKVKDEEIRRACNVGLVSRDGIEYQFIHRTFAEFFFARRMLKDAGRRDMMALWLERLFVDERFARVRKFVEDILHLMSEESVESQVAEDFFMLEKENLDESLVDDISNLTVSIHCLVLHSSVHTLQYFADSFGESVAKLLIQDFDWNARHGHCLAVIKGAISAYKGGHWLCVWNGATAVSKGWNAFNFALFCILEDTDKQPWVHLTFVKKMLDLVKKYEMLEEIRQLLLTRGLDRLLPMVSDYYVGSEGQLMYTAEILSFLLENKEIFGDALRGWIASMSNNWGDYYSGEGILRRTLTTYFDLVPSVMGALYDETQLKHILAEDGLVSKLWIETLKTHGLERARQVWDFIKESCKLDVTHLRNYLTCRDKDGLNALVRSAYDKDPEMIVFIWELAGELMEDCEKKKWLFVSFCCPVLISPRYLGWSFHKFLARLVDEGFLSGNETVFLLTSREGQCCILNDYPIGFFTHILPIDLGVPRESYVNILCDINFFYQLNSWLEHESWLPLNEHLKDQVEKIFNEVRSHDIHRFTDQLVVDETGCIDSDIHEDRFKFFVAVLFKQVEFCRVHFGPDGPHRCLKSPPSQVEENILHHVTFRMTALCLGYVCSVLIESLSREDFLGLLLERDEGGETVFHWAVQYRRIDAWNKLNDVAGVLLGEVPQSEIHEGRLDALREVCACQRERLESTPSCITDVENKELEIDW